LSDYTRDYKDKVGLVTGSGSGIGRTMAIAFAAAGAKVLVADVNATGGEETVSTIRAGGGDARFVRADVTRPDEVEGMVAAAIADFGRLDFAVNNAGTELSTGPLAECSDEAFDQLVAVNVKGVFLCMKHEIRQMLKHGCGAIVNMGSVASFRPQPTQSIYTATKHAVMGLTRNAAVEYGPAGIRINAICPGAIDTPLLHTALDRFEEVLGVPREQIIAQLSLNNRIGQAEEIAKAALWLCSDDSSYTYGHALAIDGGYLAR
jgi:NAD(P)-dependent dehydrogenase (short-subunit alcohol dehydrogenase family)